MDVDVENRRHLAALTLGVLALTVVASVGFASVSDNPLVPDASFSARDAPDEYDLGRSGTVDFFAVEHTGGEPVALADLQLVLGSRSDGARFNASTGWQFETDSLVFTARVNGRPAGNASELGPGDTLVVSKTSGTADVSGEFDVRIRLFHRPSRRTLLDQQVQVR